MVHRMLLARVGDKYIHLLKMFGAFFTFGCVFNVFAAAYQISVAVDEASLMIDTNSAFGTMMAPIGSLFLWLGLMVLGLALYRSDRTIMPFDERGYNMCSVCGVYEPEICRVCLNDLAAPVAGQKGGAKAKKRSKKRR